jgi:drug/metabolite transporter (DMT)-like permease
MSGRKSADGQAFLLMVLLCAIWGGQQVSIKLAAGDIAPVMQVALRSIISGLLMLIPLCWSGAWSAGKGTRRVGMLAGSLFALEFCLVAVGLQYTSASHMVVFLYTAPIFSALGLHLLLPSERLRALQWMGIGLCFVGIGVAFSGGFSRSLDSNVLIGDALGVLAGLAWGATTVVVRCTKLSDAPPSLTLFYQLSMAVVLLLAYAGLSGQLGHVRLTGVSVASLMFQGLVVSFFSFFMWFWLLRRYRAANLGVFTFMTPLFGVTFGVLILDEQLAPSFIAAALLVLAGIGLVNGEALLRRAFGLRAVGSADARQ